MPITSNDEADRLARALACGPPVGRYLTGSRACGVTGATEPAATRPYLGDCLTLLSKGEDFTQTDVAPATPLDLDIGRPDSSMQRSEAASEFA